MSWQNILKSDKLDRLLNFIKTNLSVNDAMYGKMMDSKYYIPDYAEESIKNAAVQIWASTKDNNHNTSAHKIGESHFIIYISKNIEYPNREWASLEKSQVGNQIKVTQKVDYDKEILILLSMATDDENLTKEWNNILGD